MRSLLLLFAITACAFSDGLDPSIERPLDAALRSEYEFLPAAIAKRSGLAEITVRTRPSRVGLVRLDDETSDVLSARYIGSNAHLVVLWCSDVTANDWTRAGITLHSSPTSENDEREILRFRGTDTGENVVVCPVQSNRTTVYVRFEGEVPATALFAIFRVDSIITGN